MSVTNFRVEQLKKDNYDTWKIQARAFLIKNNEWGYAAGTIHRPLVGNDAMAAWDEADSKAMSDLILSISPGELKHLKGCHLETSLRSTEDDI